ncbi:MAG: DinB family protein [Chitinophagales bacterium]|nr:DinB family protein [Chitinophagales bacterium]
MQKQYRTNGAAGAFMDIYENVLEELKYIISDINTDELKHIADPLTKDVNCRSIQTVLSHVVKAGHNYVIAIRNNLGEENTFHEIILLDNIPEYISAMDELIRITEKLFNDFPNIQLEVFNNDDKIVSRWGQQYDPEQLLEHAIVHVMRHQRQIERFLQGMRLHFNF